MYTPLAPAPRTFGQKVGRLTIRLLLLALALVLAWLLFIYFAVYSEGSRARATVKAMKSGRVFYYLPDKDYGRRDSIFVPFFGVPAGTITGLSRLTRLAGAIVVPCVTRMLPDRSGYRVELGPAWTAFPSDDIVADTARMNAWLERVIETMPEQYYGVHRRFKTRPEEL